MDEDLKALKDIGLAAMDIVVDGMSTLTPLFGVAGSGVHTIDTLVHFFDYMKLRKIDQFINNINSFSPKHAEAFRVMMFPEHRSKENAMRIIHDIFSMDLEKKVDFFSFAGINISVPENNGIFTPSDFFRAGMILSSTLKEDLDFLYKCDLNDAERVYPYSDHVQGLVSAGLMYPFDGTQYKFTAFAKKLDCFALDEDGSKYGLDYKTRFSPLPEPEYKFHAYFA